MRRADLIPLALVVALAGVVGFAFVRQPHVARVAPVLGPDPSTLSTIAVDADSSGAPAPEPTTVPAGPAVKRERFTPDSVSEEINRRIRYGAAGTYIMESFENRNSITRWPERPTEAIRVWIEPSTSLPDWNRENVAVARDGIKRWVDAGIPVRINFVVDSSHAEVLVRWADKLEERAIGTTTRFVYEDLWMARSEITIALHDPRGPILPPEAIRAIAAHEAGHMLGLDHSPYDDDIMSRGYGRQVDPSGRDLQTMRLLYTLPPGRFR